MKKTIRTVLIALSGIVFAVGLTLAATSLVSEDLSSPVQPLRPTHRLAPLEAEEGIFTPGPSPSPSPSGTSGVAWPSPSFDADGGNRQRGKGPGISGGDSDSSGSGSDNSGSGSSGSSDD